MKICKVLLAICPALDDQVSLREEKRSMMSTSTWNLTFLSDQLEIVAKKPVQFVAGLL